MSDRRRNALVLSLVAALVIISLLVTIPIPGVSKPRKTQLGLDLKGGVELIFQGRASGSSKVDATTISDAINIINQRVNQLGVSNASITSSGSNEIDVSLAGVKNAAQAEAEVGTTAQLYFYDWEANVIGPNGKVAGPNDSAVTGGQSPGSSSSALTEYAAVMRAAKQPETPESATQYKLEAAPYGTYYYVDPKTQTVLTPAGETASTRAVAIGYLKDDMQQSGTKPPADAQIVWVKPGTVVRQAETSNDEPDPTYNFYYVLRDQPAIAGKDISSPSEQIDPTSNEPVVSFGFKGADQQKPAGIMSGGERNRMNLALTLKQGGNLLLLDEPTNDLDVETLGSLENALLEFPGCAVITSHDRWFLDRVATHILAWEGGANWFWFEGNFDAYEKNKIERLGAEAARPHRVTYRKLTRG